MTNRIITLLILLATYLTMASWAQAGQPAVSHLRVTDVGPLTFSLVWISSEPSTCSLRVYDEQRKALSGVKILSESSLYPPAEDLGVMKVRVSNLEADTTYYLHTVTISKADGKLTVYPKNPVSVHTEKSAIPVNNIVLAQKIYFKENVLGNGSLMVVSIQGGSYPVSGWVGGQAHPPSPWALVDLNNIYSGLTNKNLEMLGGETINVEALGGLRGYSSFIRKVPSSFHGPIIELKPAIVLINSTADPPASPEEARQVRAIEHYPTQESYELP